MALEEIFVSLGELFSSILHLLPLFYPIFTRVDPDPQHWLKLL